MSETRGADDGKVQRWDVQLHKGCIELAVLASLWPAPRYGLEILRTLSRDAGLDVPEGTIYPLLTRLRARGLVASKWVEAEAGHPRKYYRLTPSGRAEVVAQARSWQRLVAALSGLLAPIGKDPR